MRGGYPGLFEDRDPRVWARANLGGIALLDEDLPETIRDVLRVTVHLADPDRILLFGSRARGDHGSTSDFDFLVEGVRDRKGFLLAKLDATEGYLTLRKVDLVCESEASADLLAEARREGKVVYERES